MSENDVVTFQWVCLMTWEIDGIGKVSRKQSQEANYSYLLSLID